MLRLKAERGSSVKSPPASAPESLARRTGVVHRSTPRVTVGTFQRSSRHSGHTRTTSVARRHWTRRASLSTLCADAVAMLIHTAIVVGWIVVLIAIAWGLKAVLG